MTRRFHVLATNALDPAAQDILAPLCDLVVAADDRPDTLRREVADADALIVRVCLPDDIFDHAKRLRACVRHGVGLDFIPVSAATRAGIPVANLPDANTQAVVEHVVAAALSLARRLPQLTTGFSAGDWNSRYRITATELQGRILGIVGFGRIGRGVAAAMHAAFGMKILVHTRHAATLPNYAQPAILDEVFAQADIVTLHVPAQQETRHMVDARHLGLMKAGTLLINTARGNLIVDEALLAALATGRVAAAALDVFKQSRCHQSIRFYRPRICS